MINNDIIRSIRHMHNISEGKLIEIIQLGGGRAVPPEQMSAYLKREDEPGFEECPQNLMDQFLNGLIYFKRGKDDSRPPPPRELPTNNVVLKKLRVAFALKDEDIVSILQSVDFKISKAEVNALFRKEGHPNYRVCGDQLLRNFLKGLTARMT
jgi:uncharacterized protein YehS (DUF1456 family)